MSSTAGSRASHRTPSPTSCRCCAGPSPPCPRASAAASANACAKIKGQSLYLQTKSMSSGRDRPWRPWRGCSVADERLRRWRLVLGGEEAEGTGQDLGPADRAVDSALAAVYGERE